MLLGSTLIFMIIVVTTGISDVPYIDTTTTLLLATGTFFAGVLLLPSGWYSALRAIVIYVIQRPDMSAELERLIYRLSVAPQSPDIITRILLPTLKNRLVILGTLMFGAIIVPLLEELIKPIGVWMLVGQKPTPSQGFVAGLLSGAGYAMFENLALSASAGDAWSMIMLARTGTSLIHIMTTGLMGWSLALAWNQGKHLRLVLTYLGVVLIHGLWNGLVLTFTFASYSFIGGSFPEPIMKVGKVAPYLLVGLVSVAFILLIVENLNLRRAIISPASVDTQSNHISPTNKRSILN